jgi:hypothetical protein
VQAVEAESAALLARAVEPAAAGAAATEGRLTQSLIGRLNPFNYAFDGLGSNFGNVRYRPPRRVFTLPDGAVGEAAERIDEAAARRLLKDAEERTKKANIGRGANHLKLDERAQGPHSTFKTNAEERTAMSPLSRKIGLVVDRNFGVHPE